MKKIVFVLTILTSVAALYGQKKEINVLTGEEILKLLPDKVKDKEGKTDKDAKKLKDKVKEARGILGVTVRRTYGDYGESIEIEVIDQSPSLVSINDVLDDPLSLDMLQYLITTIDGYKGLIQTLYGEDGHTNYQLLIPMEGTLLSIRSFGYTREGLLEVANEVPIAKIAKLVEREK